MYHGILSLYDESGQVYLKKDLTADSEMLLFAQAMKIKDNQTKKPSWYRLDVAVPSPEWAFVKRN